MNIHLPRSSAGGVRRTERDMALSVFHNSPLQLVRIRHSTRICQDVIYTRGMLHTIRRPCWARCRSIYVGLGGGGKRTGVDASVILAFRYGGASQPMNLAPGLPFRVGGVAYF
ncbi:hypothetical protein MRB53_037023 [Persea americana]|nr:hypothetical protein MRB53_037023 [Persea americana]